MPSNNITLYAKWLHKANSPAASIASGNVAPGTIITLSTEYSDNPEATILYTTDGTDPSTFLNTYIYADGITIDGSTTSVTLKVYVTVPGYTDSDIVTYTYTVS